METKKSTINFDSIDVELEKISTSVEKQGEHKLRRRLTDHYDYDVTMWDSIVVKKLLQRINYIK